MMNKTTEMVVVVDNAHFQSGGIYDEKSKGCFGR